MKKRYLYTLLLGLVGLTSCEDDATPVLSVKANAILQELPKSDYVFTADNASEPFTVKWTPTDYGFQASTSYTVMLTNLANEKSVELGTTSANELSLTNENINLLMNDLNVYPGQQGELAISLDYSAYEGKLDSVAGNVIKFKATPYDPRTVNIDWDYAYVAVYKPAVTKAAANADWNWATAYMIGDVNGDGKYEGWVNFEEDNLIYKVLDGKTYEVLGEDQTVAKKGFYQISVVEGEVTQSANPVLWGVAGDATPKGWGEMTKLDYNSETRLWSKVIKLLAGKEFKFRADPEQWYGIATTNTNNDGGVLGGEENIKVIAEEDQTYLVTLNLTEVGKYSYTLEAVDFVPSTEFIYLPGDYQKDGTADASADDCLKIQSPGLDYIYTGTFVLYKDKSFNFYEDTDVYYGINGEIKWEEDGSKGTFNIQKNAGDKIKMDRSGNFRMDLDTKNLTGTITKAGWEVIGDATPGEWSAGTVMDYDPETKLWSITVTLKDGGMKFRKDGDWSKGDLGGDLSALTDGGGNITVTAGTYEIVLNVEAKTATMTKK